MLICNNEINYYWIKLQRLSLILLSAYFNILHVSTLIRNIYDNGKFKLIIF